MVMRNIVHTQLPNLLFKVSVPKIATYDDEELEYYGLPMDIVNNSSLERSYNDLTTVFLSIDRIIDIYDQGYPIRLVDKNDLVKLYDILENYLRDTGANELRSIHKPKFKEDRLEVIDRFLNEMHSLNNITINKEKFSLQNGFNLGLGRILAPTPNLPVVDNVNINRYGSRYARALNRQNMERQSTMETVDAVPTTVEKPVQETVGYVHNNVPTIDFSSIKRQAVFKTNDKDK